MFSEFLSTRRINAFSLLFFVCSFVACNDTPGRLGAGGEIVYRGERPDAALGSAGQLVGDLNGDGFSDLAVGAPSDVRNGTDAGSVYVFYGSVRGPDQSPSAVLLGGPGDRFGSDVAALGDVNGDGLEDFAVSARGSSREGILDQGIVFLFLGRSGGLLISVEEQAEGVRYATTADGTIIDDGGARSGEAPVISSAGDLDQNGNLDLMIGFPGRDRVFLFLNGTHFPTATRVTMSSADITLVGPTTDGRFGEALAAVGNVDGENRGRSSRFGDDVLIGAPEVEGRGAAYLLLGEAGFRRGTHRITDVAITFPGSEASSRFGAAVAGIGDFDLDLFSDIAIGAPETERGRVEIYFGEAVRGPQPFAPTILEGENVGDRFGASISGFLGAPFGDAPPVVVGAPENDFSGADSGSAYLFTRNLFASGSSVRGVRGNAMFADLLLRSPVGGAGAGRFGTFVHAGLDLNGDGSGDLLVGAPQANTAGEGAGAAVAQW